MELNIATFMLPKTFEAKEGQQVPSDAESEASKESDHEVKYPEFTLYECDLVYSLEEPSPEMTKHIKPFVAPQKWAVPFGHGQKCIFVWALKMFT